MMEYFIVGLLLLILSIIDIGVFNMKKGGLPSALTTSFIIISLLLSTNMVSLIFGVLIGFFLLELGFYEGVAELKAFIIASTIFPSILYILILALLISLITRIYKFLIRKSNKKIKQIPLIPVITISYIATIILILF